MYNVDIETRPKLRPSKLKLTPRNNVEFWLEWDPSPGGKFIPQGELLQFEKDFRILIKAASLLQYPPSRAKEFLQGNEYDLFQKVNGNGLNNPESPLLHFWERYGPPFQVKGNRMPLSSLIGTAQWVQEILDIYQRITAPERAMPPAVGLLRDDFMATAFAYEAEHRDKIPKYWIKVYTAFFTEMPQTQWIPSDKFPRPRVKGSEEYWSKLPFVLPHPPCEMRTPSREDLKEWQRKNLIFNITHYLSKQRVSFTVGKSLQLKGYLTDLLSCFLLNTLETIEGLKPKRLCECGCGESVYGSGKFVNRRHYEKARDSRPDRKIKSGLRTKKIRLEITEQQHRELCKEVDDLFKNNNSEQYIREKIELQLRDIKRAGK
ncbi:Hypothetical protein DEACI_3138 [Acididesulfobacillus acetoxydans]|uniref:Uncharacterized protein n=1 Tax=Acididesulfobacillus acetoxydans TaxID=1561005 RepID=A0A8S0WQ86_9FIRM|nr:hypothetical protein [Acididesulfobacillus acetoxydans]CAA7602464.1 Hypothetical protein DEACI_3138 [Acididesulfobacillus acetoxydans]CEJ05919.1 Hypothetical protein DEACI_0339 [Acididesulfobacillus acetoxydans]